MPRVFLSYSSKDSALALRIAADMRSWGIEMWLDRWEIRIGDSITQAIQSGLEGCDFVAVLLSEHSVASGWVEKEWQSMVGQEAEQRRTIILPLRVDTCKIPVLLRDKKYADFMKDYDSAFWSLLSAIRELSVAPFGKTEDGLSMPITQSSGYDLATPSLSWLKDYLQDLDWVIPLQKLRGQEKTVEDLVREYMRERPVTTPDSPTDSIHQMQEVVRFPWGLMTTFRPDIIGAVRLPNTKMYGWVVGLTYPCTMFEYDVIRARFYIEALASFKAFVFWDMDNGFSYDGFAALRALGTSYPGIDENGSNINKSISYVMYVRPQGERKEGFVKYLEDALIIRSTLVSWYWNI